MRQEKKEGVGHVNADKFKGKVVEKGMSIESLAEMMNLDRSTIYRKINNNGDSFTVKELRKIVSILNLSMDDVRSIFFENTVA